MSGSTFRALADADNHVSQTSKMSLTGVATVWKLRLLWERAPPSSYGTT